MIHYSSEIATQALRLDPVGREHKGQPTICAMCSRPIDIGDLSSPLELGNGFTDHLALLESKFICGHCAALRPQDAMRHLQRAVVTPEGSYSILKDNNRAWFLLTPPKPPFFVVLNTSGNMLATMHLHWRAPVSVDINLIQVMTQAGVMTIRRPVMLRALEWCDQVTEAIKALPPEPGKKAVKITAPHPFKVLKRDFWSGESNNGVLRDEAFLLGSEHAAAVEGLRTLRLGELWALSSIKKTKAEVPEMPEPIITAVRPPKPKKEGGPSAGDSDDEGSDSTTQADE